MVRSQMGFGSDSTCTNRKTGFRSNASTDGCGRGTTPALDWSRLPGHVRTWTARLAGVVIDDRPATEVMIEHDGHSTLHYVDPPYLHSTRSDRRGYAHEMTDEDHRELAVVLAGLEGSVVVSAYRCPMYDELYRGWIRVDKPVIVFRASRRVESLYLNPRASASLASRLPLFDREP
jgi:DNA adenine methylase